MDIVKGYQIQKEAVFEHGRGFALGYNPSAQSSFVIWHFSVMADGKRNFYDCTSCRGILPPEKEFEKFLSAYDYVYKVPRLNEGQKTPATEYYRYYTRYPLDDNTFPKAKELGLLEIAPYDKRTMVENETIQTWGEVIYTKPLTEKQLAYYDLTSAPNNPDRINQRGEQAAERRQKPSISARLAEGAKQAAKNNAVRPITEKSTDKDR